MFKLFKPNSQNSNGGGKRDRTDGLLRARQALSQLSYTPVRQKEAYKVPFINSYFSLN